MAKIAVVLFNLGGPDSLDAIETFLYNLFRDPDIFKIPVGQKFFAKQISKRRAPKVAEQYKLIGGKSPINEWTEKQRAMLEESLNKNAGEDKYEVITAMRYYHPLTEVAVKKVLEGNYDKTVLLPLYPHYSIVTTGSSFNEWDRELPKKIDNEIRVNEYHTHPLYIKALNERIDSGLLKFPEEKRKNVQLLFSAHGVPVSIIKKGDHYEKHIRGTIAAVMEARGYSHEHHLCFQSKVGPVKWLGPATDEKIEELAGQGKKDMLVIPISFVSDHIETSFELDIEYRENADHAGVENYIVMEGLNDSETFIDALTDIVYKHLNKE